MCGRGSLLLFFPYILLLWFSSPGSKLPLSFLFLLLAAVLSLSLSLSLSFFSDYFPFPGLFFSFSPLRVSRSGDAATLARLTNVESSLFPSSDQQRADSLDLGVWKWPSAIVGTQGCLEGGCWPVLVPRETHGSLLGVGFWPLVDDGKPVGRIVIKSPNPTKLTDSLWGKIHLREKKRGITYTARPHGGISNS